MKTDTHGSEIVLKSTSSTLGWIFGSLSLVFGIPYFICKTVYHLNHRESRNLLPGKVSSSEFFIIDITDFLIFSILTDAIIIIYQVVVITGASSGLGEALAHTFYTAGCKVVLAARREDELERVRKDLLETHPVRIF